jgi:hypothetical protein
MRPIGDEEHAGMVGQVGTHPDQTLAPQPTSTAAAAAPALMEELIEEILLRFPPHEPARLARATLVCKPWCRLISGPRFRRQFRELHRTPPLLGFLYRGMGITAPKAAPTRPASCPQVPSPRRASRCARGARSTPATAVSSSGAPWNSQT